jgi:hypothetical protein
MQQPAQQGYNLSTHEVMRSTPNLLLLLQLLPQ